MCWVKRTFREKLQKKWDKNGEGKDERKKVKIFWVIIVCGCWWSFFWCIFAFSHSPTKSTFLSLSAPLPPLISDDDMISRIFNLFTLVFLLSLLTNKILNKKKHWIINCQGDCKLCNFSILKSIASKIYINKRHSIMSSHSSNPSCHWVNENKLWSENEWIPLNCDRLQVQKEPLEVSQEFPLINFHITCT